jgi:endonuclease G
MAALLCWRLPAGASDPSPQLALGNPSAAASSPAQPNNYLIVRPQYALGFSSERCTPLWVSWHLTASDLGAAPAYAGNFITDTSLPAGFCQATHDDYKNTGYDRGQMAPAEDRTAGAADAQATFLMTNVLPQSPENNRTTWASLEAYARDLVRTDAGVGQPIAALNTELYLVSGGDGSLGTIAGGKIRVPANTWKLIVVLPLGDDDLGRITTATRVIAVQVPNAKGFTPDNWQSYLVSVDTLEQASGYNLLSNVPPAIQRVIEARVDGPSAAARIEAASPASSKASVGSRFAAPLAVRASDAAGKPVAGVPIVFADLGATAGASFAGGDSQVTVLTDAEGIARSPALRANMRAGAHVVEASTTGIYQPVRFMLTNLPVTIPPPTATVRLTPTPAPAPQRVVLPLVRR